MFFWCWWVEIHKLARKKTFGGIYEVSLVSKNLHRPLETNCLLPFIEVLMSGIQVVLISATPPKTNIATQNDGPWKRWLRLLDYVHFWYLYISFTKGICAVGLVNSSLYCDIMYTHVPMQQSQDFMCFWWPKYSKRHKHCHCTKKGFGYASHHWQFTTDQRGTMLNHLGIRGIRQKFGDVSRPLVC